MQRLQGLWLDDTQPVPRLLVPAWTRFDWLIHGFSTRLGGVSDHAQGTLNLGLSVGDQPAKVQHNRDLWLETLGAPGWPTVYMQQVHGQNVSVATEAGSLPHTDAVLTNRPKLVLNVLVADCLPILLCDPVARAVGVIHAGWRGTVAGIVTKAVMAMTHELGTHPENLEACIGPGVGGCCYLVDEPVIAEVRAMLIDWPLAVKASSIPGQHFLDLAELNRQLLRQVGVLPEHIHHSGLCTMEDSKHFYSHRRDHGNTGRLIGSIGIVSRENAGFPAVSIE